MLPAVTNVAVVVAVPGPVLSLSRPCCRPCSLRVGGSCSRESAPLMDDDDAWVLLLCSWYCTENMLVCSWSDMDTGCAVCWCSRVEEGVLDGMSMGDAGMEKGCTVGSARGMSVQADSSVCVCVCVCVCVDVCVGV